MEKKYKKRKTEYKINKENNNNKLIKLADDLKVGIISFLTINEIIIEKMYEFVGGPQADENNGIE